MIKVLLVDDDVEMLQGLSGIIRWEDYGFTISGKAESGLEALNFITELMPDMVITDITMPLMDGLELIREAKKFKPDMKSVIISCHEDFSFAKEAIRLEADEYILKHTLTEDELIRVLNNLKEKIQNERKQRENLYKANREININKEIIIEKFFTDILGSNLPDKDEICSRAALSGIVLPSGNFRLISFFVDDLDEVLKNCPIGEYGLFKMSLLNIIEETANSMNNINIFPYRNNAVGMLLWDNTTDVPLKQKIISSVREIQKNVELVLKFKLSVCLSGIHQDILELKNAAAENDALREAYFYNGPGEIVISNAGYSNGNAYEVYKEFASELKGSLSTHRHKEVEKCADKLFSKITAEKYPATEVRTLLRRIIVDLEAAFGRYDINLEAFQIRCDTLSMYREIFQKALGYICKKLSGHGNAASRPEIKKVTGYIEIHINEEISCDMMANYVNMNSNYFSRLFKSETGTSFSEYLINKRMEVATELLKNSEYSIDEITRAIGIESISYFYRAYKKITGNTPGDIRNRARLS